MVASWDQRSASEQHRVRDRVLAEWLPEVCSFAPHWTDAAERAGLTPREATSWGDLLRLAPSVERDLLGSSGAGTALVLRPTVRQVEAHDHGLLERMARALGGDDEEARRRTVLREYKPVHVVRAGTDGRLAIASSPADLDRAEVAGGRTAQVLGLSDHDYVVSALPGGPTPAYWGVRALALGASMLLVHARGHGEAIEDCTRAFRLVPATAVVVPRDEAEDWAAALAAADADVSRVVRVVVVGPPPGEEQRGRIVDAWRAAGALEHELQVLAVWAPDQSRSLWAECAPGSGLHVLPEHDLLEVDDPGLGADDGWGELVLTSLGWRGTGLLRLRTGVATAGLAHEPCEHCGRTLPRLDARPVVDAWVRHLVRGGTTELLDLRSLPDALELVPGWRGVLERDEHGDDRFVVHVAGGSLDPDRLADRVARRVGVRPDAVEVGVDPAQVRAEAEIAGGRVVDLRA